MVVCVEESAKLDLAIGSVVRGNNPALRKPALRCLASNNSSTAFLRDQKTLYNRCRCFQLVTGPVSRMLDAAGNNNFLNHSRKCGRSIQPDSLHSLWIVYIVMEYNYVMCLVDLSILLPNCCLVIVFLCNNLVVAV